MIGVLHGKWDDDIVSPRTVLVQIEGADRHLSACPRGVRAQGGCDGLSEEGVWEWAPIPLRGGRAFQNQTRVLGGETDNVHGRTARWGSRELWRSSGGQETALLRDRGSGQHDKRKYTK